MEATASSFSLGDTTAEGTLIIIKEMSLCYKMQSIPVHPQLV